MFYVKASLINTIQELGEVTSAGFETIGGHRCYKLMGIARSVNPRSRRVSSATGFRNRDRNGSRRLRSRECDRDDPDDNVGGRPCARPPARDPVAQPFALMHGPMPVRTRVEETPMIRCGLLAVRRGSLLALAWAAGAQAQAPGSKRTTSAVELLDLGGATAGAGRAGSLRELVCRGKPGIDLRLDRDPSPRNPKEIVMVLRYQRSTRPPGSEYQDLEPGSCSWNPHGWSDVPPEPGVVYFDLPREAQGWSDPGTRQIDTTINAAVHFPDLVSVPRYLSDPQRYWLFYVDDATNVSISFGAYRAASGPPTFTTLRGRRTAAVSTLARTAELRCRGGAGLAFNRGAAAGTNLVSMTLAYAVSRNIAGATGRGLDPGTCAWADRAGMKHEPGRMAFTTAGNAQLKQAQSGSAVDRTPTAAERWPDANTIPAYMSDPGRFWTFTVTPARPDTAQRHGAWKPSLTDGLAGPLREASPSRTIPGSPHAGERPPGSAAASVAFDAEAIHGVQVTPGITGVEMRFKGPARQPLVQISTSPPLREPSSGRWILPPGNQPLRVVGGAGGAPRDYSAVNTTPLTRNTEYHYLINAPEPAGGALGKRRLPDPAHQAVGTFRTLRATAKVRIIKLRVIDDSDDGSDGDLAFTFMVNDHVELEMGTGLARRSQGTLLDWESGSTHWFTDQFTVSDAPDLLRIHVSGFDNDAAVGYGSYTTGWNAQPGGDASGDWNYAKAEYHLDQYPERSFDFPFKIRTGPGSKLQFEVEGRVSVSRE